jgi:hypothetical protein
MGMIHGLTMNPHNKVCRVDTITAITYNGLVDHMMIVAIIIIKMTSIGIINHSDYFASLFHFISVPVN